MLRLFFKDEKTKAIDKLIADVLQNMERAAVGSEEYSSMMAHLERLYKLKAEQRRKPVSRDTIAIVAGNLLGILLIVAYEQKHVMSSKGFTQIIRPKSDL